jgi:hypothetical protein
VPRGEVSPNSKARDGIHKYDRREVMGEIMEIGYLTVVLDPDPWLGR